MPVGTITVPSACVAVSRNMDYDFLDPDDSEPNGPPYRISKPVSIGDSRSFCDSWTAHRIV